MESWMDEMSSVIHCWFSRTGGGNSDDEMEVLKDCVMEDGGHEAEDCV